MTRTIHQLLDLSGKTALITGASRGLGLQLAQALGEAGARIMITARKEDELTRATQFLRSQGITVDCFAADCSDASDIAELADKAISTLGCVNILVNNAGAGWSAPAEDHAIDAWDKVMNLNVRGYFLLSQHIAKKSMIPLGSGRIINVASIAALGGNTAKMTTLAYNTSKGAVLNFTRALGCEWGKYNITVNAICPGFFPSKMSSGLINSLGEDNIISRTPLRRLGDEEDLKGLCVLFASDAGKFVTGQWLAVDGGLSVLRCD